MESKTMNCTKPDKDVSSLICGYPLPCPHHTYVVDMATERVTVPGQGGSMRVIEPLRLIARSINIGDERSGIDDLLVIHKAPPGYPLK